MNAKSIVIVVITVAVIAWAWQLSETKAPQTDVSREVFASGLLDRINEVQRFSATSAEHETVLTRDADRWVIANKDNFPADDGAVRQALLQLAALRGVEPKTRSPERYAKLGVADVSEEGATGTRLIGKTAAGETAFDLIVGHVRDNSGGDQRYVRPAADAQSWLVDGALEAPADPIRWLDASVVDIDTDRVREVRIDTPGETPIHIVKAEAGDSYFELQNVPEDKEAKSKTIVSSLGALLLDLRFNDVAGAARVAQLTPGRTLEVRTFDGLIARGEEFTLDDSSWMRFSFDVDADLAAAAAAAEQSDAAAATGDTAADAADGETQREPVADEAARLNAATAGWLYVLPDYKLRMVTRGFDSLVKDPEPESPPAAE